MPPLFDPDHARIIAMIAAEPWWKRLYAWFWWRYVFVRESLRDATLLLLRRKLYVRCAFFVNPRGSRCCRKDACFSVAPFEMPVLCIEHRVDGDDVEVCRWIRAPHWRRGDGPFPESPFFMKGGQP